MKKGNLLRIKQQLRKSSHRLNALKKVTARSFPATWGGQAAGRRKSSGFIRFRELLKKDS